MSYYGLLGYDIVQSSRWIPTFWRNVLLPFSDTVHLLYKGSSINKVTRPFTCVMFYISFKFPARSEQLEHYFLSRTLDHALYQSYCPTISCKMAGLVETWSKIEVCSVIRFLQLKGTSPAEIHRQLVEVYGANVMSWKHVWVWCTAYDNSRTASVSCYGTTIGRYWTILPTALTWHRVIFISLDH
jgi:hypothetical protein